MPDLRVDEVARLDRVELVDTALRMAGYARGGGGGPSTPR